MKMSPVHQKRMHSIQGRGSSMKPTANRVENVKLNFQGEIERSFLK